MGKIDERLAELNLVLPAATEPKATYVTIVRSGNLLFTALFLASILTAWPGHISESASGELITGKVGKDLTLEEGNAAAHRVVLSLIATLKQELGDLDHIKRFVKLSGFVNSADTFTSQAGVINGASDTLGLIFGAKGKHARTAIGTNVLPLNAAVEIEAIVEVAPSAPSLSSL